LSASLDIREFRNGTPDCRKWQTGIAELHALEAKQYVDPVTFGEVHRGQLIHLLGGSRGCHLLYISPSRSGGQAIKLVFSLR
jgi:hypothetical protein